MNTKSPGEQMAAEALRIATTLNRAYAKTLQQQDEALFADFGGDIVNAAQRLTEAQERK